MIRAGDLLQSNSYGAFAHSWNGGVESAKSAGYRPTENHKTEAEVLSEQHGVTFVK